MNSGLDPETLVVSGHNAIPASNFLPPPTEMGALGSLNHLSYDNAAVEYRPSHTSRISRLTSRLGFLLFDAVARLEMAKERGKVPWNAHFTLAPIALLHDSDRALESVSQFGCSPSAVLDDDYCSRVSVPNLSAADTPIRSAGFHIHQELAPGTTCASAVAVLDGMMGLSDVGINENLGFSSHARLRRQNLGYGKAGEYRIRQSPAGRTILEYRTLSPWPMLAPQLVMRMLSISRIVCRTPTDQLMEVLNQFPNRHMITRAINNQDITLAKSLQPMCWRAWGRFSKGAQNAIAKQWVTVSADTLRTGPSVRVGRWGPGRRAAGLRPARGRGGNVGRAARSTGFIANWR